MTPEQKKQLHNTLIALAAVMAGCVVEILIGNLITR